MIFQIAGLPRSGTAWITAVLNLCPDIICVHEPVDQQVPVPEESYMHTGQAGSHLILPYCSAMEADLRIFIKRNLSEAYDSINSLFEISVEDYRKFMVVPSYEYEAFADIVVDFDNLFTENVISYLWESISSMEFQRDKALQLLNMNIQRESLDYDFTKNYIEQFTEYIQNKDQE